MKAEMVRLGDFIKIKHGFAFKSEHFAESGDTVLLTPGNFGARGGLLRKVDKDRSYDGPIPAEFVLAQGDVLVAMTDLTQNAPILGATLTIPEDGRYLHNQRLGKVIVTAPRRITLRYAAHVLNLEHARAQIRGSATGATVRHTAPDRIGDVKIPLLPFDDQIRATTLLDAIDDLIDNNLRRIRVLEEVANLRWSRFDAASSFDEAVVEQVLDCGGGTTPSRAEERYWSDAEADTDWYTPSDLTKSGFVFATSSSERLSSATIKECSLRVYPARSVMMTSRATIGAIAINTDSACTNQGFIVCLPNERLPLYVLFHWMRANVDRFQQLATGSTFKELTRGTFRKMSIRVPAREHAERFQRDVAPLYDLMLTLQRRVKNLRNLRDLLLPKVLSGEVDVSRLPLPPPVEPADAAPPEPLPEPRRRGRRRKESA